MRPQARNQSDFMIPAIYSNQSSSLMYAINDTDSLKLCSITKNDSAMACYKEMIDDNNGLQNIKQKMPELFALADIQKLNENETVEAMSF